MSSVPDDQPVGLTGSLPVGSSGKTERQVSS